MKTMRLFPFELRRLLQSRLTWLIMVLTVLSPVAGLVLYYGFRSARDKYGPQLTATICAALSYMAVYSVKVFFFNGMFLQGLPGADQCWLLVLSKLPATVFNGVVAMVGAPILGVAVMRALRGAHMGRLLT